MSEPVTNVEIEDVLSSIRRLVSEEGRKEARAAPRTQQPTPADRLVLTPSLRVPDSDLDDEVVETGAGADDEAPWRDPDATLYEAAEAAAERDDAPDAKHGGDDEPVTAEAAMTEAVPEPGPELDQELDPGPDEQDTGVDRDHDHAPDPGHAHDLGDASDGPQAGGPSVSDGVEDGDELVFSPEHMRFRRRDYFADGSNHPPPQDDPAGEDTADRPAAASLSAKIEALEKVIGSTQDEWEPDGETDEPNSGSRVETIEWRDHRPDEGEFDDGADFDETPPRDETDSRTVDIAVDLDDEIGEPASAEALDPREDADEIEQVDKDDDRLDLLAADEAILDEESLRELVTDIVREELQGALGERITRNVRKLVRREIHRALAAQELD